MVPVSINKYKTPTAASPDCAWSVGVMFLTEAEADIIAQFARGIRSINSPRAQGLTATAMRERGTSAADEMRAAMNGVTKYGSKYDQERYEAARARVLQEALTDPKIAKQWLTGDWSEPTREPELDEPRNRFSGLDIPEADKP